MSVARWAWVAAQLIWTVVSAGSVAAAEVTVCVISPRTELDGSGQAAAEVVVPRPTVLTAEPLLEMRLERAGQILWQRRATAAAPIEGPMAWPIAPIEPEQSLLLLLQPVTAAGAGQFARIRLTGASREQLAAHQQAMQRLGSDPAAWLVAVNQALDQQQVALAWALLFAPQAPRSAALDGYRQQVWQQGCGQ